MNLASTQRWFFSQLQPGARRAAGPVCGSKRLPAKARIDVYADMYVARLCEALEAEFPRLREALGESKFATLARQYFRAHPSRHPTIQHVGLELPSYLATHPPKGAPFAADLAKRDRAASEVYVAEGLGEDSRVTAANLQPVPPDAWPRLKFEVTPTLRLLPLQWRFPKNGKPERRATVVRIWRRGLDVFEAELAPDEKRPLLALRAGKPLNEVCIAAGTAERAATLLATWVEDGLLTKLYCPPMGGRSVRGGKLK